MLDRNRQTPWRSPWNHYRPSPSAQRLPQQNERFFQPPVQRGEGCASEEPMPSVPAFRESYRSQAWLCAAQHEQTSELHVLQSFSQPCYGRLPMVNNSCCALSLINPPPLSYLRATAFSVFA